MLQGKSLNRFLTAQNPVIHTVFEELREGRKQTHWMWFVFPQIAGLGQSETSRFYSLRDKSEARDYLNHPVLGERLRQSVTFVLETDQNAEAIFGYPDHLKFRSSMTLFSAVAQANDRVPFERAIREKCDGKRCAFTERILTTGK